MSCSRYRQLISRYVDDEVTPRQRRDLLAHVQVCADCAAWLARARQTDVLLKGVNETHPSDRVRNAILNEVRAHGSKSQQMAPVRPAPQPAHRFGSFRLSAAGILLRFDPSPGRIALGTAACLVALLSLAYSLNLLPPLWGYNKLGFEDAPDRGQAVVDTTPIPISAVSSGQGGVGGPVAVPNLVRTVPGDATQAVALDAPLKIRFDQPMDRGSVENALQIDPPVAGVYEWDADNELSFTPAAPGLLRGITYTVTLTTTALSMAGTPLRDGTNWSFRTEAAHTVATDLPDGTALAPTGSLTLTFDVPMSQVQAQEAISLRAVGTNDVIPLDYKWDAAGTQLVATPKSPVAEGYVYLRVSANAPTADGGSLGQPFEFKYRVDVAAPPLQLPGDRILLAQAGGAVAVPYTANAEQSVLSNILFDVYALPAARLSEVGAQADGGLLPSGYPSALQNLAQIRPDLSKRNGTVDLDSLTPGIYLLVAALPDGTASDWKMLVVNDDHLAVTGSNSPLWATTEAGRPWAGAEISLYSSKGTLLEKGLADQSGLWLPTAAANDAGLALALDPAGHVASALLNDGVRWGDANENTLPTDLITDLSAYRPGGTINFRLLLHDGNSFVAATPVAEQDVLVSLVMPGGATVAMLNLKPDSVGGISGLFPISPDAEPGVYTINVRSGGQKYDFDVTVLPVQRDTLSVYIVPSAETEIGDTTITRTVSVLGESGEPVAGALVTGTLGIPGDSWVSDPVTATTDADGRALIVSPLPDWFTRYNEPGLFLSAVASHDGLIGSDKSSLDLTALHSALYGMTQLASPDLNVAVVVRPASDAPFKVRVVLLNQTAPAGDILLQAESPTGEHVSYSLDMARLLDATVEISQRFAGGTLTVRSSGAAGSRTITLMPAQYPDANLQVVTPYSVTAGSELPLRLTLTNLEGVGTGGTAAVWLRRASGEASPSELAWEPSLLLPAAGTLTTTLQAPSTPGLWYVMSAAATPSGTETVSWGLVRVMPGPWVQLPPAHQAAAGETRPVSVVVHNPSTEPLSTGLRTTTDGQARIVGASSQAVDVVAGGWGQFDWQAVSARPGAGHVTFSFMPSSGSSGSWPLAMHATENPRTNTTYTAGVLTGERSVGVAVPSGLSAGTLQLEIRASTSLLPSLTGTVMDFHDRWVEYTQGVSMAAARLSGPASVASAYVLLNAARPDGIELSSVERSVILQQLYSAQREDGGWSYTLDGLGASSVRKTAEVLLAMHRQSAYSPGGSLQLVPDAGVIRRGLDYLSNEVTRPVHADATSSTLDERAYGLYVLSLYTPVPSDSVRLMLAYTAAGLGERGLTRDGQAWLALALWQVGNSADAVALLDRLLLTEKDAVPSASPAMLEALVVGLQSLPAGGSRSRDLLDYSAAARNHVRILMEARQGAGWRTPAITADALWALSRYAAAEGETPQSQAGGVPLLTLGDRPVQVGNLPNNPGVVSVVISGDELHAGTNWLNLKAPDANQALYYSLTLIATR
ncbi:MAG: Ig-like domain-containing protein [Chloroflexota bacterium]